MKALIYDGSHLGDPMAARVNTALHAQLLAGSWDTETIVLREQRIGNCAGDFFCWVRSPGLCNVDDDNRVIAAKMMQAHLLVYLTPVTFGGYSSALKRMVDHQIQNILPQFANLNGETHHRARYDRYPNVLAIGWSDQPDRRAEAIFHHLVQRNGLNMHATASVSAVVSTSVTDTSLAAKSATWLEAISRGVTTPAPALPEWTGPALPAAPVRRAALLVGSPRTRKSTSASLGGYLLQQLATRGLQTDTIQLYTEFSSRERRRVALATLAQADLIVLAIPLYVDALPAPVVAALETIAAAQMGHASGARFVAIANCGFPEAAHTATALAICAEFARESGFAWAGGLALGAGEGMVHGAPLDELGGRATSIRQALAMAAAELAEGRSIPQTARDLMARAVIPNWLYRLVGGYGWRQQAKRYGAVNKLRQRPYLASSKEI